MRYCAKTSISGLAPKVSQMSLVIQQGLQEPFENITTSKNYLVATALDPGFKVNVFTSQLQREETKQYILIDSLKMNCETSSDNSTNSSAIRTKRMMTEEQSVNQTIHSSFMKCFKEVVAEKKTTHIGTSKEKNAVATETDFYLSIKNISHHDNRYK
ncbi:hypothetical protein QE152_g15516 [Popillia japonica]|uniref:Uncharacterized protein n=1 Tax=Popillia japonica TaxID=7064 RepID=A0AAW1L7I0_POPJA